LREEIAKECAAANQHKAALDDNRAHEQLQLDKRKLEARKTHLAEQLKRLQQKIFETNAEIKAADARLVEIDESKKGLAAKLKEDMAHIRSLSKKLVVGAEESDQKVLDSANGFRLKALTTVR